MEVNRLILQEVLADSYEIQQAADGLEAVIKLVVTSVQRNFSGNYGKSD
ncbi:hypothetical protein KL86SPO_40002 [uncultured Sporomusa sp.]|uniref:Uncharacterized protein n=1 Tax=uncultured Sporomusa sp. TaxID=307249 RepID=A0A212LVM1_9FIRM|nr:hypothetical protein KL86SPO_40002 [uncultured Sporomusa sp.]